MAEYTVALNIEGKRCLIVGGGSVAARKAHGLLEAGAAVTVISPLLTGTFPASQVQHIADIYRVDYLLRLRPFLVFAATYDAEVNRQIAHDARENGILVNVVDRSSESDFSNTTVLHREPLTIAISTGGSCPVLGQHLRDTIDDLLGEHYPLFARWLGELRPQVIKRIPEQTLRHAFWQRVMDSDALDLLKAGQQQAAYERLMALMDDATGEASV
jgi:uroporphyrin-III C-methyltransferase/precorrin-2 dehydrogenase/sirohydrochlorin ferrochelatase